MTPVVPNGGEELQLHGLADQVARLRSSEPCATVFEIDCDRAAIARPDLEAVLDAGERAAVSRLRQPQQRQRATVLRGALRWILGVHLGVPPERVPLVREPGGRPRLRSAQGSAELSISSASCGALGAIVLASGTEVGIDLECVAEHRFPPALARHILHPREVALFEALPLGARCAWLTSAWVCKEALLKTLGLGLRMDPRLVEVMSSDQPARPQGGAFRPAGFAPWQGWVHPRGTVLTALAFTNPATRTPVFRVTV